MNKLLKFGFVCSICLLFTYACSSSKGGGNASIKKNVEEFYTGKTGIQYFIKPLSYSDQNDNDASVDLTIRNSNKKTDTVTVNITIITKTRENMNSLELKSNSSNSTVTAMSVDHFYTEIADDGNFRQRVSGKMMFNDFEQIFTKEDHTFYIKSETESVVIIPSKKTIRKIKDINQGRFMLFQ